MFWRKIRPEYVLLILFLAAIFLYAANPLSESDSFYHLRTGQLIWEAGAVPAADVFSYTAPGAAWVTHEWLAELIFYAVYRLGAAPISGASLAQQAGRGGFWPLIFFVAALAVLTYYLIFRMAIERGAHPYAAAPFLFLFGYLTFELWIPRPQVWSYVFFAGLIFLLERYRLAGNRKNLFWVPPFIWLWANMNASFLLGLLVIGLYAAAALFQRRFTEEIPGELSFKRLAWLFAASALLAVLNPSGYKVFLYPLYIQPAVEALRVWEWAPITQFLYHSETRVFLVFMFLADVFIGWWFVFRRASRDWLLSALTLAISMMPFISIRHVGFWPLAAIYPLIVGVSALLAGFLGRISEKRLWPGLAVLALLFIGIRAYSFPPSPVNALTLPVRAVDFIEENGLRGPLFNLYNEGGYLIWRLYPEEKVFIDGRSEVFPPEVIGELFAIATASPGWEELVDEKYRLNYFLLSYRVSDNVSRSIAALQSYGWPLVYWDDSYVILVRPSAENGTIIQNHALRHVSPVRDPRGIPWEEAEAAAKEMQALLEKEPDSKVIQNYTATFLGSRADIQ